MRGFARTAGRRLAHLARRQAMDPVPLRLLPGVDLRAAIEAELAARSHGAGFVLLPRCCSCYFLSGHSIAKRIPRPGSRSLSYLVEARMPPNTALDRTGGHAARCSQASARPAGWLERRTAGGTP